MDEFVKCSNCGAEMTTGGGKCPVCGADNQACTSDEASGSVRGAARPSPKKSAFAPAPAGTVTNLNYDCDRSARPRDSIGCFSIIISVIGFAVSFVVSIFAALHFFDWLYVHKIANVEIFSIPVIYSVISFAAGTSFLGAALGYNFSAYIVAVEDFGERRTNFISMPTMACYYICSFAIAVPFGIIGSFVTESSLFLSLAGLCVLLEGAACIKMTLYDLKYGEGR